MTRDELVGLLWEQSPLFLTLEEFEQRLADWQLHELEGPNGLAIIVVTNGPEFHFAKFDATYQITRGHLRRWPGELVQRYGYAQTRTPKEDIRQQRFNERLGFQRTGEDEHDIHYRITRMRAKE